MSNESHEASTNDSRQTIMNGSALAVAYIQGEHGERRCAEADRRAQAASLESPPASEAPQIGNVQASGGTENTTKKTEEN